MVKKITERQSIFEIERRKDFSEKFSKFYEDISTSTVDTVIGTTKKMLQYLEYSIRYWPYRRSATSISDYLFQIGVDIKDPRSDTDYLLIMELMINLLHYANKVDERDRDTLEMAWGSSSSMHKETSRLLENADYILEQCCNMQVRLGKCKEGVDEPQYYICKRDAAVDAAIEAAPELVDVLLGYMDIRNAKDRGYKESTLTEIYKYLEPRRKEYGKGIAGSISEEFFAAMNKFNIRHSKGIQIKLHYTKRNALYDKLFRMALYVLQSEDAVNYRDEIKALRENG